MLLLLLVLLLRCMTLLRCRRAAKLTVMSLLLLLINWRSYPQSVPVQLFKMVDERLQNFICMSALASIAASVDNKQSILHAK
jgi:hypothetical protein